MPSSMTHTYFGLDVFDKLPCHYQGYINNNVGTFKGFCQGADPFMFYHFFMGKKARNALRLQHDIHKLKTQEFFIRTIHSIHDNNYLNESDVMGYLYGYICHYYLDLYVHPFIYYKSGVFEKDNPATYQYNGLHEKLEYNIDLYLIKNHEDVKTNYFKVYKNLFKISKFSLPLKKVIYDSIEELYSYKNVSRLYLASFRYMKMFFHFFNYDPLGIKLGIYKVVDKITPPNFIKLEELSFYRDFESDLSYLNLEHLPWKYPWDESQVFNSSFFDLYDMALKDAVHSIKTIVDMLEDKKIDDEVIKRIFPDLSYVTGRPCKEKIKMKYFEF